MKSKLITIISISFTIGAIIGAIIVWFPIRTEFAQVRDFGKCLEEKVEYINEGKTLFLSSIEVGQCFENTINK